MRKFYIQQTAFTAMILAVWTGLLFLCLRSDKRPVVIPGGKAVALAHDTVEPREEASGEVARVHRFNAEDERTEMEVTFKDKTRGVVTFNAMGQPSRAVEYYPNGTRQVFNFGPNGIKKRQSLREDNTLISESLPGTKGSVVTRRFANDGKTVMVLEEKFSDGTRETTVFKKDGRTPELRFRGSDDGMKGVLTTFTDKGVVKTVEKFERTGSDCGMMDCPEHGGASEVELTRYREDGKTVWYKATFTSQYGNSTCTAVEEYHADGKTLKRRVKFAFEPTDEDKVEGDDVGVSKVVELFDEKGQLRSIRLLRDDNTVSRDETFTKGVATGRDYFDKEAGVKETLDTLEEPSNFMEVMPKIAPQDEPNHLKQMMSR